jgi:hypothetical protein
MSNLGTLTRTNDVNQTRLTLPNTGADGQSGINVQYNIYQNRFYGGDTYFHYKTNIPMYGWSMHHIEAVGYTYGNGYAVRCYWCFHVSGGGFYNANIGRIYFGLNANTYYSSSDGYAVIVAQGDSYFSGWSFNAYSLNPTGPFNVQITAAVQTNTNANYY